MKIDMIAIPSGKFLMGSLPGDIRDRLDEQPQTSVFLSAYSIQRVPVTVGQWAVFLEASGYKWDRWQDVAKVSPTNEHPIVFVNWFDCVAFTDWLTWLMEEVYSLPTEAQWERACRGTKGQLYPWQEDRENEPWDEFSEVDKHKDQRFPVGSEHSRPSVCGCLDMWQNVREWCLDWYDPEEYINIATSNPDGTQVQYLEPDWKVFRGGNPAEAQPVAPDPVCHGRGYASPSTQLSVLECISKRLIRWILLLAAKPGIAF